MPRKNRLLMILKLASNVVLVIVYDNSQRVVQSLVNPKDDRGETTISVCTHFIFVYT